MLRLSILLLNLALCHGFSMKDPSTRRNELSSITNGNGEQDEENSRRGFLSSSAALVGLSSYGILLSSHPMPAKASGGATAGKYTTIPIAKRRYYGRVQQAVHDYLDMGPAVIEGDMTAPIIQTFFDTNGIVVVPAKKKDINGVCTKKDGDCKGKEIRDSRWNDMKASMYLLGNAFRINQQKAPDNLPTVRAAKAFFKEIDAMQSAVLAKKPKKMDKDAIKHYAAGLEILDQYLDLVELPPTESGHYDKDFNTLVGEFARIT